MSVKPIKALGYDGPTDLSASLRSREPMPGYEKVAPTPPDRRLEIATSVLSGLLAGGHRAESGPQLVGLAWQYAGWLLEEAGK